MKTVRINLPEPFPWQKEVLESRCRFKCVLAGRRSGKTEVGVAAILRAIQEPDSILWWCGLTWKSASMRRAWRLLKRYTQPLVEAGLAEVHEVEKTIYLPHHCEIWMRSAENEESLAGEGIRGVVIDEFSLMSESVWTTYLYQTLLDYQGWALFMGVPRGFGWSAQIFQNGVDNKNADWHSWQLSTLEANPFITPEAIEQMRRNLTNRLFRQEILAEILPEGGSVLPITTCVIPCEEKEPGRITSLEQSGPLPYHQYIVSCDWARDKDYTVMIVWDATVRRMVEMIRMSKIQYTAQIGVLKGLNKKWRPYTVPSEETGNMYLHETLLESEVPVQIFKTTNKSKNEAVLAFALALEQQECWCFDHPRVKEEFSGFMAHALPGGGISYAGAKGVHDDIPMSSVIGWSRLRLMPKEEQMTGADRVNMKMAAAYDGPATNILDGMSREMQRREWLKDERKRQPKYYRNAAMYAWIEDEGTGSFN